MKKLTLDLPDDLSPRDYQEVKMHVAAVLFEKGVYSSGQAAELLGITKRDFLEKVGSYGASIFGESTEDLRDEPEYMA